MNGERQAGILMPVSALPSPHGVGTLGKEAYRFVDGLARANMRIWQVLPLLPTSYGDSPYQSYAAGALNYYFIDFDLLKEEGLLEETEYASVDFGRDRRRVDYEKLFLYKTDILRKAFARFDKTQAAWQAFLVKGEFYDFALFMSLKAKFSFQPWTAWEPAYRHFDRTVISAYEKEAKEEIDFWQFTQYLFLRQWQALKRYANEKGVLIMGDMPIYLSTDSVEAWKYKNELFLTDEQGNFSLVAGVPPDAFSADGQLWGNPLYDWEKMEKSGYAWWKKRIDDAFSLFDIVRIDHFRGFDRFYAIPVGETSAKNGEWLDGPKAVLFEGREDLRIVAEDLGMIDDGVRTLMQKTGYPGMKVMLFSFGDPTSEHKPSNYRENCFAYTGTHDNETFCGFLEGLTDEARERAADEIKGECEKLGVPYGGDEAKAQAKTAVELVFASKARAAIAPFHDVLALGAHARINFPSTLSTENWSYRYLPEDFSETTWAWLKSLAKKYDRV